MKILQIVILVLLAYAGQSQNLTIVGDMVGINLTEIPTRSFEGNEIEADSITFRWTCDPFQPTGLTSQEIQLGDTLWFPKEHYLIGYIRAWWTTDHDFTCHIANVQRDGDNMPDIRLLETPGFGSNLNLPIVSNAKCTRVAIVSPYFGMIYYKNFQGVEGQENLFHVTKYLPIGGKYTMFVRGFYSDEYLCKPSTSFAVSFVVVQ